MKVIFHRKCEKFVKKISDVEVRELLRRKGDEIIEDVSVGKLLEHPFRKYQIRSVSFDYKGNSYRIAYTFHEEKDELVFLLMDSRENFYEKLKRFV